MSSQRAQNEGSGGTRRRAKRRVMVLGCEVRRSALRLLNGSQHPVSTIDLAEELGCSQQTMSYQLSVLSDHRLISRDGKPNGGSITYSWSSTSKTDRKILDVLDGHADEDAAELKARKERKREPTRAAA